LRGGLARAVFQEDILNSDHNRDRNRVVTLITTYTDPVAFAAYAHEIGPLALIRELISNGTPAHHAYMVAEQLFGDGPLFCEHCHQEIIDEDE
jgi:hypothetical protein